MSRSITIDEAIDLLRQLTLSDPSSECDSQGALSAILLQAGRPHEALQAAQRALDIGPYTWAAHAAFGAAHLKLGRPAEALTEFQKAIELSRNQIVELHAWLGSSLSALGRHVEALEAFERVTEVDPDYFARRTDEEETSYYEASKAATERR